MIILVIGVIFGVFAIFGLIADNMPDYVVDYMARLFRLEGENKRDELDELQKETSVALRELNKAYADFENADKDYSISAAYEIKAKKERYNALLREIREKMRAS